MLNVIRSDLTLNLGTPPANLESEMQHRLSEGKVVDHREVKHLKSSRLFLPSAQQKLSRTRLINRNDRQWYPAARQSRQSRIGNWDKVMEHLAAEPREFI